MLSHARDVLAACNWVCDPAAVCVTDKWEELGVNNSYVLGEPMYFEVAVEFVSKDRSVYVEACHIAASEDSNSTQRYDIISNFG